MNIGSVKGFTGEEQLQSEITRLTADNVRLVDALNEVMEWIYNWSPSFTNDEEWEITHTNVKQAIAITKAGE